MLAKLRTIANLVLVCIAIERTFAAFKRDRRSRRGVIDR